jgi:hypothetical protein
MREKPLLEEIDPSQRLSFHLPGLQRGTVENRNTKKRQTVADSDPQLDQIGMFIPTRFQAPKTPFALIESGDESFLRLWL